MLVIVASRRNIHHRPAPLWRFRDSGTGYKNADYLLTYLVCVVAVLFFYVFLCFYGPCCLKINYTCTHVYTIVLISSLHYAAWIWYSEEKRKVGIIWDWKQVTKLGMGKGQNENPSSLFDIGIGRIFAAGGALICIFLFSRWRILYTVY